MPDFENAIDLQIIKYYFIFFDVGTVFWGNVQIKSFPAFINFFLQLYISFILKTFLLLIWEYDLWDHIFVAVGLSFFFYFLLKRIFTHLTLSQWYNLFFSGCFSHSKISSSLQSVWLKFLLLKDTRASGTWLTKRNMTLKLHCCQYLDLRNLIALSLKCGSKPVGM